jgi:hypothetical protein
VERSAVSLFEVSPTYGGAALIAEAMATKVVPGIDSTLMPVIPTETDGIAADRGD